MFACYAPGIIPLFFYMFTFAQTTVIGIVTGEPTTRKTKNGRNVTSFSVAVDRPQPKKNTNVPATDFHKIVAWQALGDSCSKYLQKGHRVAILGTPHNNQFETREGEKRYVTELYADRVFFLERAQKTPAKAELEEIPKEEELVVA